MQTKLRRKRKRRVERGDPITELVKGSYNYTLHTIQRAFYLQFRDQEDDLWIRETFRDHVIVSAAGDACSECREHVYGHGPFWFAEVEIPVSCRGGGSAIRKRRIFISETFREVTGDERKFGQQLGPVIERERKRWRAR